MPPFFFLAIVPRETTVYGTKTNVHATRTTTCEILEEASGVQLKKQHVQTLQKRLFVTIFVNKAQKQARVIV